MQRIATILLFLVCGCSASHKVEIRLVNTTPYPLTMTAQTWLFRGAIVLPPGGSWSGFVDRRFVGPRVDVTVKP